MNKEIARKWLKQANHDLLMAEKNIEIGGYNVSSFLAHQSIEKLLKAIFAIEGKTIPKIHYLDELASKLELSDELFDYVFELVSDYMFSRYPDVSEQVPFELYDEETAKTKVETAPIILIYAP